MERAQNILDLCIGMAMRPLMEQKGDFLPNLQTFPNVELKVFSEM